METSDINMDEDIEIQEKKPRKIKKIIITAIIVLPIVTFGILYTTSPTVKKSTNKILAKLPGGAGDYFKNMPTESDNAQKIEYLSDYYLGLDKDVAADKMYIIKTEDEKIYKEVVKSMNLKSPEQTEEIIIKIRDLDLRKNTLTSVFDQVEQDQKNQFNSEVSRIESQDILESKLEIERKFSSKEFQKVLKAMNPASLGGILYYTDSDISGYIINLLDPKSKLIVNAEMNKISNEIDNLKNLAKYYETKPITEALKSIGNTDVYNMEQLAVIYANMSISKSSQILSKVEDDKFIQDLFVEIKKQEELSDTTLSISSDIGRSIEFFTEYNGKLAKLRKVYEDMQPKKVAEIAETMLKNDKTITIFNLDMDEVYDLSDKTIIVDILSGLKKEQLSKVISAMKTENAVEVTELLAKPSEKTFKGGENINDTKQ